MTKTKTKTKTKTLRCSIAAAALVLVSACGADEPTADPGPSESHSPSPAATPTAIPAGAASTEPATPARAFVAFGDSWPYGAHCNGCTPFPDLYAEALDAELPTGFTNLTEDGGTSDSLLAEIRDDDAYRTAIEGADVIVISVGANDLEDAFGSYADGDCGPPKDLGCFREVAKAWGRNMDAILTEFDDLRGEAPTAIRVLTQANEDDPGLRAGFGEGFVTEVLPQVMAWQKQAFCHAAARHHDRCVDLRPVLNGPNPKDLRDVNTQEAMQEVADALLAIGLPELKAA